MEHIEKDVGIRKRNLKSKGSFRPCIILIILRILNDMLYIFCIQIFSQCLWHDDGDHENIETWKLTFRFYFFFIFIVAQQHYLIVK